MNQNFSTGVIAPGRRTPPQTRRRAGAGTVGTLTALWILISPACLAATVPAPYEIGTWQGFRTAAITYTFDDNCSNQFALAVPMFNAKGLKLTMFPVTSWLGTWTGVQNAAAAGHEIGSHTLTHANLSGLTDAQQTNELQNSQILINANVTTQKCLTVAYPYCTGGKESITSQYYIAARNCSGVINPATPANFMQISCYICGSAGAIQTLQNFTNTANNAYNAKGWCVYLIHGIDSDGGYSPLPSATLQASVDFFSNNPNKFWVQTFGNVARYIRERNAATVVETSNSGDVITLQVTDALDDSIYNCPITLRRPLPAGWPAAGVTQNGAPIPATLVPVNGTNYVMFDVVPDAGEVVISKDLAAAVLSDPALATPTDFSFRLDGRAGVRYAIYASGDGVNWLPVQTNTLLGDSTNLSFGGIDAAGLFRAQWAP